MIPRPRKESSVQHKRHTGGRKVGLGPKSREILVSKFQDDPVARDSGLDINSCRYGSNTSRKRRYLSITQL